MTQHEGLTNLRKRVLDAVKFGALDESSRPIFEQVLIQIMNEAERQRQKCDVLNDEYKRKAAQAESQSSAYSSLSSIVYAVLNGFVSAAEKSFLVEQAQHETRLSHEENEKLAELMKQQNETVSTAQPVIKTIEFVSTEFDNIKKPTPEEQKEAVLKIKELVDKTSVPAKKSNKKNKPETTKEEELAKVKSQLSKKKKSKKQ